MKVVVDRDIPFIEGVLETYGNVEYVEGRSITRERLLDADALIVRTRTKCNEALLSGTKVRFIASATIGYDHLDTKYCQQHGIQWTNAPGCNSSSVLQYIAAALFHLSNKLEFPLAEKTIGIVGVGNVGSKVAGFCTNMGMRVLLNDPPRERREGPAKFVTLDRIIEEADIVSLHVPLTSEGPEKTFHLIDERLLSRLRPKQILLNTSRGEVVDSVAFRKTLSRKGLAASVVDVWEKEPDIDLELLHLVDIGTPHIAGYSADGKANGTSMSVRALSRFFHLGIDDWYPSQVPEPDNTLIELDCSTLKRQKIVCKLVTRTYDILADDQRLRNSPHTFEKQRAAYPVRREFPLYTARLLNAPNGVHAQVKDIGFKINA